MRRLVLAIFTLSFLLPSYALAAGVATMGLVGSGADFVPAPGENPQDVLRRALLTRQEVHILPGVYQFTDELIGTFTGAKIVGPKTAILKPATSGTVGLFDFSGDNITLEGFTVKATTFVTGQSWIKFTSGFVYSSEATIAATNATTLTDSANGFITAGFKPGDSFTLSGFTGAGIAANLGAFTISTVAAGTMTVTGPTMIADAATGGETVVLTKIGGAKNVTVQNVTFHQQWSTEPTHANSAVTPTGTATDADCVKALSFIRSVDCKVIGCTFLPDYGGKQISAQDGTGLQIYANSFTTGFDSGGLGSLSDLASVRPRLSNIVIEILEAEWCEVIGNRFFGLGTGNDTIDFWDNAYEVPHYIKITSEYGGAFTNENGHNIIANNSIEYWCSPKLIAVYGAPSTIINGNLIGYAQVESDCGPNELGEAAIVFSDGNDGGSGNDVIYGANVFGNDIHNCALSNSLGAAIYAQSTSDLSIKSNIFAAMASNFIIQINSATCESPAIVGNSFRASGSLCFAPIHLITGGAVTNGVFVGVNDTEGYVTISSDDPGNGVITGSGTGTAGVDNFMGTVGATATTITRTIGSFVTDGWQAGDTFTAAGLDTAADNSKVRLITAVAALTLTFIDPVANAQFSTDADNGTDVVLTENATVVVANDSGSTADYFLEGLGTINREPWVSRAIGILPANTDITSNVLTRASGSFVTDGFAIGDLVRVSGIATTAADNRAYQVTAVAATTLTLLQFDATAMTNDADEDAIVVIKIGGLMTTNGSLD